MPRGGVETCLDVSGKLAGQTMVLKREALLGWRPLVGEGESTPGADRGEESF